MARDEADSERGVPDLLLDAVLGIAGDLELSHTLRRIVKAAATAVDARYGALGVVGADGMLDSSLSRGLIKTSSTRSVTYLRDGDSGSPDPRANSAAAARPVCSSATPWGSPEHHPPMHSFLGVPIRVRQVVFGNLYLTEKRGGGEFTARDERLVVALAAAAAVAIDNSRLYESVEQRAQWLRAASDIAALAFQGATANEVLTLVVALAHEMSGAEITALIEDQSDDTGLIVKVEGPKSALSDMA